MTAASGGLGQAEQLTATEQLAVVIAASFDLKDERWMASAESIAKGVVAAGWLSPSEVDRVRAEERVAVFTELADYFMAREGIGWAVEELCRRREEAIAAARLARGGGQ